MTSPRQENIRDGRIHLNWFEMNQKNKPQSNALATGILMMLVSGMHICWGIFNTELKYQKWARHCKDITIIMAILMWYIGAVIGSFCGAPIVNRIPKRKISTYVLMLYGITGIILTASPADIVVIYVARFLAGFAHGVIYTMTIVHAGEIVIKELRGMIVASLNYVLFAAILTAASFHLTVYDYSEEKLTLTLDPNRWIGVLTLIYVCISAPLVFFLSYESPVYLLRLGNIMLAIQTMMRLRNESSETWEIRNDIEEFKTMISEDKHTSSSVFENGNKRPLRLIILTRLVTALSFNYTLNNIRLAAVFSLFGKNVEYNYASLVIPGIRMGLGLIVLFTVDRFGRKPHFTLSAGGSSIMLVIAGIMSFAGDSAIPIEAFGAIYLLFDVFCSLGTGAIPDILSSEAFASTKKSWSIALTQVFEHLIQIVLVAATYNRDLSNIVSSSILLGFGILIFLSTIVLHFKLPETTKMSIRQTRNEFTRRGEIVFSGTNQPTTAANLYS